MKKYLYVGTIVLAAVLWGSMPVFSDLMREAGFLPIQKSAVRLSVAAIILLVSLAIFSPKQLRVRWKDIPFFMLIGVGSVFAMSSLYMIAIEKTTAAVAAVLLYTSPIFILIASVILFKEKITRLKLFSLALVVLGVVFVSGIIGGGEATVDLFGFGAGLLAGIVYAAYSILCTFALRKYSSITVTAYSFLFAAIANLLAADFPTICATVTGASNIPLTLLIMLGLGVVTAVLPFTLYTLGLSRVEAGRAGILACIEPMTATLFSVFLLHEPCTGIQWAGILLILAAVVLLQIKPKKKENTYD